MRLIKPNRRLFLARAAIAVPALITSPRLVEAFWQSRDSTYNQNLAGGGGGLGLQTNLGGFWSFEDTSWSDDTGLGSTLTATGSPTSSSTAPSVVGNYLGLNGSSSLGCASNSNLLNGGGSFSVQVWAYVPSVPGQEGIVSKNSNSFGQKEWNFGAAFSGTNRWVFRVYNTSTTSFDALSTTTVATNTWAHLVGTFDGASKVATIYCNGASQGTATLTGTMQSSASAPLNVGVTPGGGAPLANGARLDQLGFWKGRVLSAGDVTALYNSGAGLSYAAMA